MNLFDDCFPKGARGIVPGDRGGLIVSVLDHGPVEWEWQPDKGTGRRSGHSKKVGLEVTREIRHYPELRAAIVAHTIRNVSDTELVLTAIGTQLEFDSGESLWQVTTCSGGTAHAGYPSANFEVRERTLLGVCPLAIGTGQDGRSSNDFLPMVILAKEGREPSGLWCGLEWSGEWNLTSENVTRNGRPHLKLVVSIGIRRLRLAPGEELAFPPVHLGFFEGRSAEGTNAIRRYIFESLQPSYRGRRPFGAVSFCSWFGLFNDINTADLMRQATRAAELGIEVFEVDAGWFGDFDAKVGNWDDVDRRKFPDGLEPLADHVRSLGMDFGIWFEPERCMKGNWAQRARPEFFWPDPAGRPEFHLNLSLPDAQDWVIGWMSNWISLLGARWIRYDCNITSGIFFNSQDFSRKVQFGYVAGLYRVFDELRRRHPDLMIENCASGGRRMDFGTIGRTHTTWFSDYSDNAHTCRCMVLGAQRFLPGNCCNSGIEHPRGRGAPEDIDLEFISRIIGKISIDGDLAALSPSACQRYRHWIDVQKRTRHLVVRDYQRLTRVPLTLDDWDAVQWSAYDGSEGLLACFRIHGPERHPIAMVNLDAGATYRLTNLSDGTSRTIQGSELLAGHEVTLAGAQAGIWHWVRDGGC